MANNIEKKSKFSGDIKQIWSVPNILTYIRIILVPIMIVMFLKQYYITAFSLFFAASVTDVMDGYIARKFNLISDIGKALDPFADKFLQVSLIILLSIANPSLWILTGLIFAKELTMIVVGTFLIRKNIIAQANIWGKVAAAILFSGLMVMFIATILGARNLTVAFKYTFGFGYGILSIGVFFVYFALVQYAKLAYKAYKRYLISDKKTRIYFYENKEDKNDK